MKRTFYEFFCGGGMARIGLGPGWRCALANDLDPAKCAAYRSNFGDGDLIEGDIHDLSPADLPGRADLAWASFPCQDLSLAGARKGFGGRRSAAFWGFHGLMASLAEEGRAPRTLVIENVAGFATSRGGGDLAAALAALAEIGYAYDVRLIDAAAFLPQSRPRLFIIAWRAGAPKLDRAGAPKMVRTDAPMAGRAGARRESGSADRGAALAGALAALPREASAGLAALDLPQAPLANIGLDAIVEPEAPLFSPDKTAYLLSLMAPKQRAKIDAALERASRAGAPVHGALFRRMRGGAQRAEVRFDRAGCLRTPAGGSSKQILVILRPDGPADARIAARWLTGREAARLMGLPETYRLPGSETQALKLAGDGVAAPVVRWIAEHALAPLLARAPGGQASLEPAAAAE